MQFEYDPAPQRSPDWFQRRIGKVTASRLVDWLAVSKAKATTGKPLKPRLDYERELMFERQFSKNYNVFVNDAMQDGIDLEDFARKQYEMLTGCLVAECGCWFNDYFVASPDGIVTADNQSQALGLVEIKVLRDNSFAEVLANGVPDKHWKQVQGQLWASGFDWCDYIAMNTTTRKLKVIRVLPDAEFFEWLELAVAEPLSVEPFSLDNVYDIVGELPDEFVEHGMNDDKSDSNLGAVKW